MRATARAERKRERRRILIAVAIAVVVHAILIFVIFGLALVYALLNPPPKPPEPIELTIIPPEEPETEPEGKKFVDSGQLEVTEEAPEDTDVESDANARAASERAANNDRSTPTVDGESEEAANLRAQEMSLGPSERPSPPSPQPQPRAEQQKPPEPEKKQEEKSATPTPQPDDLAVPEMVRKEPEPTPEVEIRKPEPPTPPTVPRPPGFQPQTRPTRLTGGITNRGKASIAAVATPLGRYKKSVSDAIGSRWYYYVSDMIGMVRRGTTHITFVVQHDGRVRNVRVTDNSSNESLASVSVRSIVEAEIPPIPREIADSLEGQRLEFDFSFTIE